MVVAVKVVVAVKMVVVVKVVAVLMCLLEERKWNMNVKF